MKSDLRTLHGRLRISQESPQLVSIDAESDAGAYFGQGYVAGKLRLWQLDLTRRVAAGELSALFGSRSLATDRFQRNLGLRALARREMARDANHEQAAHVRAYVEGINVALKEARLLPVEFLLLRSAPRAFTPEDVYLVAQLKYFINSAWQFELFHTLVAGEISASRAAQLFATFSVEGDVIDPLPRGWDGEHTREIAETLEAGLSGLKVLGLSSPDIGSNAFAIKGTRTASGLPLLATDPHMGNVNPGYNMLFKLRTDEGLCVFGSHFPGVPGIIVGRNECCGWGMVGLMADNQDLLLGTIDADGSRVRAAGEWVPLECERSTIETKDLADQSHIARGFAGGRMVHVRGDLGLFLRWPALDSPLGGVSLNELSRAHDWESYRRGLARMTNAPMLSVFADAAGNIGLQAVGLIPKRRHAAGSLVLSLDDPSHQWQGYVDFDELPRHFNPPGDWIVYANQYTTTVFGGGPHLSNRWHPPSRATRLSQLLERGQAHCVESCANIQDDKIDLFARQNLPFLRAHLPDTELLGSWNGDTRDVDTALLFERWMVFLTDELVGTALTQELCGRYVDLWPGHRWNTLNILRRHSVEWGIKDVGELVTRAFDRARSTNGRPRVEFRHTLRRHPLGRALFSANYPYDGGSRETIHVARRNTDFLTASQLQRGHRRGPASAYSFGPSFKFVYDFSPGGGAQYMSNTSASGNPFRFALRPSLRRWRRGERYQTSVSSAVATPAPPRSASCRRRRRR